MPARETAKSTFSGTLQPPTVWGQALQRAEAIEQDYLPDHGQEYVQQYLSARELAPDGQSQEAGDRAGLLSKSVLSSSDAGGNGVTRALTRAYNKGTVTHCLSVPFLV